MIYGFPYSLEEKKKYMLQILGHKIRGPITLPLGGNVPDDLFLPPWT